MAPLLAVADLHLSNGYMYKSAVEVVLLCLRFEAPFQAHIPSYSIMLQKSVLITGCSEGGIGHAIAIAFQQRGLTVFATARSVSKIGPLAELPNVHAIALDVTNPESIAAAAREIEVKTGGALDILLNNAGRSELVPWLDLDFDEARAVFEVNYWAPLRLVQVLAPMLIAARGVVVNIGSIAGLLNAPFQSMSKSSPSYRSIKRNVASC